MTKYRIHQVIDDHELALKASKLIAKEINLVLKQRERCQIALSGGSTPSKAYCLLGNEQLPWNRVDVFLGDERWVAENNDSSNAYMVRKTLLAGEAASNAKFYKVPTTELKDAESSAEIYAELVTKICNGNPPIFDLMILGLGDDGHTASLFPGTQATRETNSWATVGKGKGLDRITLTAPVLSASRQVIFLVSGFNKKQALRRLTDPLEPEERTPAKLVKPSKEVLIITDQNNDTPQSI